MTDEKKDNKGDKDAKKIDDEQLNGVVGGWDDPLDSLGLIDCLRARSEGNSCAEGLRGAR